MFDFIDKNRLTYRVRTMCDALDVSASGYYERRCNRRQDTPRVKRRRELLECVHQLHARHPAYGSPRIHAALVSGGHSVSLGCIEKIMQNNDIRSITKKRFRVSTTDSHHNLSIAPNLLERNFACYASNQKWLSDITYIPTDEGWLYLAVIMDMHTRRIVGWAMRDHMRSELTIAALMMAIQKHNQPPGLILHSDRGKQYADKDYRAILTARAIRQSMSRKGNCWDNAPMESFFHTLKTERVNHQHYTTIEDAKSDVFRYIHIYYNTQRSHSAIGYLTPDQMERKSA
jgi:putative transposase